MDKISCDSMFSKHLISKIVKHLIKKKGSINLKDFKLNELDITHTDKENIEIRIGVSATMSEAEFTSLLQRIKLLPLS